jgi:hypothetical protein
MSSQKTPERIRLGSFDSNVLSRGHLPQRPECLPFLIECGMRVDRHRDLDATAADDVSHDVRRDAEAEQQRYARVPDVVKADIVEAGRFPDPSPVHNGCWADASRVRELDGGTTTTLARWHQVHDLLDAGVGLGECARRLNLALNTVKRYARIDKPERIRRAPQYRPTLVDPYRDHLRKRRAEDPAVPVLQLLREIREPGYGGSQNLLYRYITQGRVEDDRPGISPRRLARMLLSRPDTLLTKTTSACTEMNQLTALVRALA